MAITLYTLCGTDRSRPFSPHVWKIAMALHHKGLAYEEAPTPFTAVPRIEGGVGKTVPVLRDGETVIVDSFAIAEYLEKTYPDRPSLFAGEGGRAEARFIEAWSQHMLHTAIGRGMVRDIWSMLDPEDQAYFRTSREQRFGATLEDCDAGREEQAALLKARLEPLRVMLGRQPFIGGETPLFADYIVFGAMQWMRVCSTTWPIAADDAVTPWIERCLDLFNGFARRMPARS